MCKILHLPVTTLTDHSPTGFHKKDITVRGAIKDEAGSPLAGATVTEKGTNNRVIAGSRGDFTITVKNTESVLVSLLRRFRDPGDSSSVGKRHGNNTTAPGSWSLPKWW